MITSKIKINESVNKDTSLTNNESDSDDPLTDDQKIKRKQESFRKTLIKRKNTETSSIKANLSFDEEITKYVNMQFNVSDDCNPIDFWRIYKKEFPILH